MSEKCAYLVESGESKYCRLAETNIQKVVEKAEQARAEGYRAGVEAAAKVADKIGYWDDLEGMHDGQKVATAIRALAETDGKE